MCSNNSGYRVASFPGGPEALLSTTLTTPTEKTRAVGAVAETRAVAIAASLADQLRL